MTEPVFSFLKTAKKYMESWDSSWTARFLSLIYVIFYFISVENYLSVGTLRYSPRIVPIKYIVIILLFAVAPILWLPTKINRPSKGLYLFLYYTLYVPSVLIPFYLTRAKFAALIRFNFVILLTFILIALAFRIPLVYPDVKQLKIKNRTPPLLLISLGFFCIFLIIHTYGLERVLDVPALTEVYTVRDMYKQQASAQVLDMVSIAMYVIFPSAAAIGLIWRNPFYIGFGILGEILVYSVGGHRSAIALILGIVGLYVVLSRFRNLYAECLAGVFIIIALIPPASHIFGTYLFESIFFERFVVIPGLINGLYFEFFLNHTKANGEILPYAYYFFDQNYLRSIPNIIGDMYFNSSTHANGSFIASGYGTFGFLGIIFSGLLVTIGLYIYDSLAMRSGTFGHLILVGPMLLFINTSIANTFDYGPVIAPIFVVFGNWPLISLFTFGEFIVAILIVYTLGRSDRGV